MVAFTESSLIQDRTLSDNNVLIATRAVFIWSLWGESFWESPPARSTMRAPGGSSLHLFVVSSREAGAYPTVQRAETSEKCPSQTSHYGAAHDLNVWRVRLEAEDVKLSHHRQKEEPNRWAAMPADQKNKFIFVFWSETNQTFHPKIFFKYYFLWFIELYSTNLLFPPQPKNEIWDRYVSI